MTQVKKVKITTVEIKSKAQKQLKKLPLHIANKVTVWTQRVKEKGIYKIREIPGYHDEPLTGRSDRSVRMSKEYRLFYTMDDSGEITIISVEEVNLHKY